MRFRAAVLPLVVLIAPVSEHARRAPSSSIEVTPKGGMTAPVSPYGTGYTVNFYVSNAGPAVSLNFACEELTTVLCTDIDPSSAMIPTNGGQQVTVTYNPVGDTGPGILVLEATGDASDFGYYTIPYADSLTPPVVDLGAYIGENVDPGRCVLTCLDAVAAYSTPAYYSLDAPRAVTMVYRSGQAFPRPTIQLDATDTSAVFASRFSIRMRRNFGLLQYEQFTNGRTEIFYHAGPSHSNRLAGQLAIDTFATGAYGYNLYVRSHWASASRTRIVPVTVLVVNEEDSPFGWGWSMPGLQRLHLNAQGVSGVMLTEGDGSAVFFSGTCAYTSNCSFTTPAGEFSTLAYIHGTGFRRSHPAGTVASFTAAGVLTGIVDRFSNTTAYGYDGGGRLISITDPASKVTSLYYGGDAKLDSIVGPDGRRTVITIDGSGNVVSVLDAAGRPALQSVIYDAEHRLVSWQDVRGSTWSIGYDAFSRVDSMRAPAVPIDGDTLDLEQPITTYVSAERAVIQSVSFIHGTSGNPLAARTPVEWADTARGPDGLRLAYRLDRWRQSTRTSVAPGTALERVSHVSYDSNGLPTRTQDPLGRVTRNTWTGHLLVQTFDSLANQIVNTHYNAAKYFAVDSVTGGGAVRVNNVLSTLGLVTSSRLGGDPDVTTTSTYDARGRPLLVTDPEGHTVQYHYAAGGFQNTDSVTVASLRKTRFQHDASGRTVRVINPANDTAWTVYDVLNRVVHSIDPLHDTTTTTVQDSIGRSIVRDALGQTYTFQYDRVGRLLWEQDPRGGYLRYGYDIAGNQTRFTNRRDSVITMSYDVLGRMLTRVTGGETSNYRYFGLADSTAAWNDADSITIRVDALGRPDTVHMVRGGHTHRLSYSYDAQNAMLSLAAFKPHSGAERQTSYQFDQFRQLQVTSGDSVYYDDDRLTNAQWLVLAESQLRFRHTSLHRLADMNVYSPLGVLDSALTDQVGRRYRQDALGRVSDRYYERDSASAGVDYIYDAAGRLTRERDVTCHGSTSWSWSNLTGYTCTSETGGTFRRYLWDAVGNPRGAAVTVETGNRLMYMNGTSFEYDADGNMTRKYGNGIDRRYVWNALGQLIEVNTESFDTVRYEYGPFGNRVRRVGPNGAIETYVYDRGNMIAEIDTTGSATLVVQYFPGIDAPRMLEIHGSLYMYVRETPNNVIGLVDFSTNAVVQTYRYSAFGELVDSTGGIDQPLRYGAREFDETTELYYNRARWYDPQTLRFISEDPIGLAGGINRFAYVGNTPTNAADPEGLRIEFWMWTQPASFTYSRYDWDWGDALIPTHEIVGEPLFRRWWGGGGGGGEKNWGEGIGILCGSITEACETAVVVSGIVGRIVSWIANGHWGGVDGFVIGRFVFISYTFDPTNRDHRQNLAHELYHVDQGLELGLSGYALEAFLDSRALSRGARYDYIPGFPFDSYGFEEQPEIIGDCYGRSDSDACTTLGL